MPRTWIYHRSVTPEEKQLRRDIRFKGRNRLQLKLSSELRQVFLYDFERKSVKVSEWSTDLVLATLLQLMPAFCYRRFFECTLSSSAGRLSFLEQHKIFPWRGHLVKLKRISLSVMLYCSLVFSVFSFRPSSQHCGQNSFLGFSLFLPRIWSSQDCPK